MICPFRVVSRSDDADFCPGTWPAPDTESRTDIFCTLMHSAKPPVRIALSDAFWIDPAAVITNEHVYQIAQVLDFNLDLCRFGMTQGVHDCFPSDQKELLLDWRIQCARLSPDEKSNSRPTAGCDFAEQGRKSLLETRWCR